MSSIIGAVIKLYGLLERFPSALLALLFRLAVASVFWRSAMVKLSDWNATLFLFSDEYKVPLLPPEVAAYMAVTLEMSCPLLLAMGLLTRPAAAALLGMTLIIQIFVYPQAWGDHILWAGPLLFLLTRGPGALSLDHWFRRHLPGVPAH
jgi:putative oxidoreductase